MSDPDGWDWNALLNGKLKGKGKLNDIFMTLLDELKRLDEHITYLTKMLQKIEASTFEMKDTISNLEQRCSAAHSPDLLALLSVFSSFFVCVSIGRGLCLGTQGPH